MQVIKTGSMDMETGQESNIVVVRLMDGEEVIPALEVLAIDLDIESGIVIMGIGMLRDFTLGYFNGSEYQKTDFPEAQELVSLQGSLAKSGDEMIVHLHGNLAGRDNVSRGGHIFAGTVNGLAEITIIKLPDNLLYRELNEKTGLKELHIKQ